MNNLFDTDDNDFKPLADLVRPVSLDEYFGQRKIVGDNTSIRNMILNDNISSMIFWGPPGVGKTTLAKIIASTTNSDFYELSAVTSGINDIKEIMEISKFNKSNGKRTILFVDEIHRFNKAQQDAFLPFVENGSIILIGATTENPSFSCNSALLSRAKVYVLETLSEEDIISILKKAAQKVYSKLEIDDEVYKAIASFSKGDARGALNILEVLANNTLESKVVIQDLEKVLGKKTFLYDKNGEEHYNLISALHKSMRNSDPDAAIYYTARMLEAGEDPLYIVRRLIRFASEDIGMANTNALVQAVSTLEAVKLLGMPECNVNITQLVVYLSVSPKSNALYMAYENAKTDAIKTANLSVPLHLRNAVTSLHKEIGNGKGYKYAHDYKEKITNMECLPSSLKGKKYYIPTDSGNEKNVKATLLRIEEIKKKLN